jgi:2-oxoisovalerate dehydrogenase E2 component (dihydrolipoyl transacylase)
VSEGEAVAVDQPVCESHTNKVSSELSSPYAGTVAALHAGAGDRLRLGDLLLTLELTGPLPGVVGVVPAPAGEERRVHLRPRSD